MMPGTGFSLMTLSPTASKKKIWGAVRSRLSAEMVATPSNGTTPKVKLVALGNPTVDSMATP